MAFVAAAAGVPAPPQSRPDRDDDGEAGPACDSRRKDGRRIDAVAEHSERCPRHGYESGDRSGDPLRHGFGERLRGRNDCPIFQGVDKTTSRSGMKESGHTNQTRADVDLRRHLEFKSTPRTERTGSGHGARETEHAPNRKDRVGQKMSW